LIWIRLKRPRGLWWRKTLHPATGESAHVATKGFSMTAVSARPAMAADEALITGLCRACEPAQLDPADAQAMAALGQRHIFADGACVLQEDDAVDALWLVVAGTVTMGTVDEAGHWRTSRTVRAGDWLELTAAWLPMPLQQRAVAETPAVLYSFPVHGIEALYRRRPRLATVLLSLLALRARQLGESARSLACRDALSRCAGWLLEERRRAGEGSTVRLAQPKRTVASQIGATPETFSRLLRQLREIGAIEVRGHRIDLLDTQALVRLAGVEAARRHCA
jgi:CRP-like cAMP-binding protein